MAEQPQHYDFSRAFQIKLLALCCRKPGFLAGHQDVVRPAWFEDPTLVDVARLVTDYQDRYRTAPTLEALAEQVGEMVRTDVRRKEKAAEYEQALADLTAANLDEWEFIKDRAAKFARHMALRLAQEANIEDWDAGNYDSIEQRIKEAMQVGTDRTDLGLDYFKDETRLEDDRSLRTISTGLPCLDWLLNGGWAGGELVIMEAPTGQFKTGAMVNAAVAALYQDCDVVYFSHEVRGPEVARRFDGCLLGKVTRLTQREHLLAELAAKKKELGRNLFIKAWPIGTAGILEMRSYLHVLASEGLIGTGKRQLLLVCDYGQIIKPARGHHEKRHEIRENYQGLIQLAEEFNAPMVTGMQTNRQAENKALITRVDLAECYAVAGDAHIILALCQTKAERDRMEMRAFIAKAREAVSFKHVDLITDMEMTRWREALVQSGLGDNVPPSLLARAVKPQPQQAEEKPAPLAETGTQRRLRLLGQ